MSLSKSFFIAASLFLMPLSFAQAAAYPGDLIKGSLSSVYYLGQDHKRYVFPNENTYKTWYSDFSQVKIISDQELASYQIGGNVSYRPGTRMIKTDSVPKVYAISKGGQIRWIQTEAIARDVYGLDWAKQVDDISPSFFISYRLGSDIASGNGYNAESERLNALSIQSELDARQTSSTAPATPPSTTSTPPVPTSDLTYSGTLTFMPPAPKVQESVGILAQAHQAGSISQVRLYFNNQFIQQCYSSPCTQTITVTSSTEQLIRAEFSWITGQVYTVTSTIPVSPGVTGVILDIPNPEVRPHFTRSVNLLVNNNQGIYTQSAIYIDDNLAKLCTGDKITDCRYNDLETSTTGTIHSVYGEVRDVNGYTRRTETKTLSVVENERPLISLTLSKTNPLRGESVSVSGRAEDIDGIARIELFVDGAILITCPTLYCQASAGPWNQSKTIEIVARATDSAGMVQTATSTVMAQ